MFLFELLWKLCKTDRYSQLYHTLVPSAGSTVLAVATYFQPTHRMAVVVGLGSKTAGLGSAEERGEEIEVVGGNDMYVFM